MKVLWIDDDRLYVRPLAEDMEDLGCEVERVWFVDEGYKKICNQPASYDLILIDVMMAARGDFSCTESKAGKRTGVVLLAKIKQENSSILEKTKVVTVVSDPQVKEYASNLGVELHLKSLTTARKILGFPDEDE